MMADEKCNLPFGLWQAVSNDYIAAGATGCEAQLSDTNGVRSPWANYFLRRSNQASCLMA